MVIDREGNGCNARSHATYARIHEMQAQNEGTRLVVISHLEHPYEYLVTLDLFASGRSEKRHANMSQQGSSVIGAFATSNTSIVG